MQVNGVNSGNGCMAAGAASPAQDAASRSIKQQIANLQKQMQQLSSNQDMGAEEKMKKRQELQKQISELNIELRQHQMERQQAERARAQKKQKESAGVEEPTGMQSIISADASLAQAKVQGSVAKQAEGRANVLKAEIKQDGPEKQKKLTVCKRRKKKKKRPDRKCPHMWTSGCKQNPRGCHAVPGAF